MAITEVWTLISGDNGAGSAIIAAQNTGTNSATNSSTLLGNNADGLHSPADLQFDTPAGLYFLVDNSQGSTGARILIGTISGAESNTDTLTPVFTDTAVNAGLHDIIEGMAADVADNSIYFIDQHAPGNSTAAADTVFERITFSGANFSGAATVTQLATLPGPQSAGMVLDTSTPSAESAYFIKFNETGSSQGGVSLTENAVVKATWNVSNPTAVTYTTLQFTGGFTSPQTVNGSSQTFNNLPASDGELDSLAINTTTHTLYFLTTPTSGTGVVKLFSYNLAGSGAQTPSLVWSNTHNIALGAEPTLTVDPATGQYYITANNTGDAVYVGSLGSSADPVEFESAGTTSDGSRASAIDNAPVLSGITGATGEAVQGGSAFTLLNGAPTITDSDSNGLAGGATIAITNGKTGDELFVNGVQSGTLDSGKVTVAWNATNFTLTLTGADTIAEYETLLTEVTYQDTGSDTTTTGHPTRSVSFTASDGLVASNSVSTIVTIDRPPVQTTHNVNIGEGASTGTVALGDTDLDGDNVTVTGVTGGSLGSGVTGTYGTLIINANDTYSYSANNTAAINGAATGSHPVDTFTYQVSDGNGGVTTETLKFSVNRAPVLSSIPSSVTYHYANPAMALASSAAVTDPDGDTIANATVQITGGKFSGDGDQLSAVTAGTSIHASYDPTSETLTLTGPDSAANYDKVLDSVAFDSTDSDPTDNGADPTRTVTWTVSDGGVGTNSATGSETIDFVACFCPGTLIRTACGEKPVEALEIGDLVMTASGAARPVKWIGRRAYAGRFILGNKDVLPVCIKAGALADNVPQRDLWLSPHHALYFKDAQAGDGSGVLIEAADLINGVSVVQADHVEQVGYFHIELESHDVLIAEGAPAESFIDDDTRHMFHNADEYGTLYPGLKMTPAQYCAARLTEGYAVETVRRHIAQRARLQGAAGALQPGRLDGFVETVSASRISGWAQSHEYADAPVCLDVFAGACLIGQVLANRYRDDLEQAGIGDGCHGFEFTPPAGLDFIDAAIEVRRSLDGFALPRLAADGRSSAARSDDADRTLRVRVFRAKNTPQRASRAV